MKLRVIDGSYKGRVFDVPDQCFECGVYERFADLPPMVLTHSDAPVRPQAVEVKRFYIAMSSKNTYILTEKPQC